ncbi:VIT1/CCC1 transporter family protein [Nanoarchaeota archaeon]
MKLSYKKGFSFGLTSGIITTLGLIVGLNFSTHSKLVVLGGILTIAIADALSDSLGMHISEEASKKSQKSIWESTISTFLAKFLFALTFIIPVILLNLTTAVIISIIWGLLAISTLSYFIAREKQTNPIKVIGEHLLITIIVIAATYLVGIFVSTYFVV